MSPDPFDLPAAMDTDPDEMKFMEPAFWWARCARLIAESVSEVIGQNRSGNGR